MGGLRDHRTTLYTIRYQRTACAPRLLRRSKSWSSCGTAPPRGHHRARRCASGTTGAPRISAFVRNITPDKALIGICEATAMTTAQNENTGFETTLSPWTVTGGSVVRSNVRAFEGLWSAQITPSGAATIVYLLSENMPCLPGQSVTASCWAWFTNAVTSNFSASIN